MNIRRPVVLYHGSKYRLAPWIIEHFPEHKNYVEPYGGGAGVLIRKQPSYHEVYNDLNEDIVNVFRVLRDPQMAAELERRIRLTPFSRVEYNETFEVEPKDDVDWARQVILNSFQGWGSTTLEHKTGFRAKARQAGSTQLDVWNKYPDSIELFCRRMKEVVIECRDALEVIEQQDSPETLFYVDPPYMAEVKNDRHRYVDELEREDHVELAETLNTVEGMVVVSGYPCDLYDQELYDSWHTDDREHRTQDVECTRTEKLWLNDAAMEAQPQHSLF